MKKIVILLLMIIGFFPGPVFVFSAGDSKPGIVIYSEPGGYNSGESAPFKWEGNDTTISLPGGYDKLSRPFSNKTETKVYMAGNTVLVPVKLGYENKELSTLLVFDTGATTTTLMKSVVHKLGIVPSASGKTTIADGTLIDTQKITLDYIIVGPYRMDNFQAVIIDHKNDSKSNRVKGLLGMNFLRNVNYKIDFTRKMIKWSDK